MTVIWLGTSSPMTICVNSTLSVQYTLWSIVIHRGVYSVTRIYLYIGPAGECAGGEAFGLHLPFTCVLFYWRSYQWFADHQSLQVLKVSLHIPTCHENKNKIITLSSSWWARYVQDKSCLSRAACLGYRCVIITCHGYLHHTYYLMSSIRLYIILVWRYIFMEGDVTQLLVRNIQTYVAQNVLWAG